MPALTRIGGVLVQLVEIPGLIEGADEDRGGGRALLGVLRGADAIVYCHDCGSAARRARDGARRGRGGRDRAARRSSRPRRPTRREPSAHPDAPTSCPSPCSTTRSLDRFREAVWRLTGLVRVYLRDGGDPVALRPPVTVADVARSIHHELGERCTGARVWGPSARFAGQRVGRTHELADGDAVEILDR